MCDGSLQGCLYAGIHQKEAFLEFVCTQLAEENMLFVDYAMRYRSNPTRELALEMQSLYDLKFLGIIFLVFLLQMLNSKLTCRNIYCPT